MDMIVPEMIFVSGNMGTMGQTGNGDPEAFRKLLCESASQVVSDIPKELQADGAEITETSVPSTLIEIPYVLLKEVTDEDVSLEDTDDFQNTGSVGIPCVVVADLPVESAEMQKNGVGEVSAITLLEATEADLHAKSSTIASGLEINDGSLLGVQGKAETGEREPIPMKLFREEEQGIVMTSMGDRNPYFKEQPVSSVEQLRAGDVIVAQDESEDQDFSFGKVADAFPGKTDVTHDELQTLSLRQDHRTAGIHTEAQPFVAAENKLTVADIPAGWASRVIDPIIKEMQFQRTVGNGFDEVRVRLQPESLGEVVIRISRTDGQISGRILVENVMIKEVLDNHLLVFKERLSNMGIELMELNVSLGSAPDKESGAGLPARKSAMFGDHGARGLDPVVSESPARIQGGLNVLV
ncbi:MAG: flagellar hook-length control protein FliK [Firmicutes bacterium]|nr:flagellar hook-length control protein FliK [Bacillota bacterium]